jgi:hypothetical protein
MKEHICPAPERIGQSPKSFNFEIGTRFASSRDHILSRDFIKIMEINETLRRACACYILEPLPIMMAKGRTYALCCSGIGGDNHTAFDVGRVAVWRIIVLLNRYCESPPRKPLRKERAQPTTLLPLTDHKPLAAISDSRIDEH